MEHEIEIIDGYILTPRGQAATVSHDHMATEVCACVCVSTGIQALIPVIYIHTASTAVSLKKKKS